MRLGPVEIEVARLLADRGPLQSKDLHALPWDDRTVDRARARLVRDKLVEVSGTGLTTSYQVTPELLAALNASNPGTPGGAGGRAVPAPGSPDSRALSTGKSKREKKKEDLSSLSSSSSQEGGAGVSPGGAPGCAPGSCAAWRLLEELVRALVGSRVEAEAVAARAGALLAPAIGAAVSVDRSSLPRERRWTAKDSPVAGRVAAACLEELERDAGSYPGFIEHLEACDLEAVRRAVNHVRLCRARGGNMPSPAAVLIAAARGTLRVPLADGASCEDEEVARLVREAEDEAKAKAAPAGPTPAEVAEAKRRDEERLARSRSAALSDLKARSSRSGGTVTRAL